MLQRLRTFKQLRSFWPITNSHKVREELPYKTPLTSPKNSKVVEYDSYTLQRFGTQDNPALMHTLLTQLDFKEKPTKIFEVQRVKPYQLILRCTGAFVLNIVVYSISFSILSIGFHQIVGYYCGLDIIPFPINMLGYGGTMGATLCIVPGTLAYMEHVVIHSGLLRNLTYEYIDYTLPPHTKRFYCDIQRDFGANAMVDWLNNTELYRNYDVGMGTPEWRHNEAAYLFAHMVEPSLNAANKVMNAPQKQLFDRDLLTKAIYPHMETVFIRFMEDRKQEYYVPCLVLFFFVMGAVMIPPILDLHLPFLAHIVRMYDIVKEHHDIPTTEWDDMVINSIGLVVFVLQNLAAEPLLTSQGYIDDTSKE